MTLPHWVEQAILQYEPPDTGEVNIRIDRYMGGVTRLVIGQAVTTKPPKYARESVLD